MSVKGAKIQEAHEALRALSSAGSHDQYRTGSRAAVQNRGRGEATSGYHAENSGSAYGSSADNAMQRNSGNTDGGVSMARYKVGSEDIETVLSIGSNAAVSRRLAERRSGSSTGHSSNSTTGQGGSYGSSSAGHTVSSTVSNKASSGGHTAASNAVSGNSSSGQRPGVSGSSSSAPRSGGGSGGFSSRSTGGFSSRSTGRQRYSSGGCGGFSAGSSGCWPSGGMPPALQGGDGLPQTGEKEIMQNLNSRLSAYMDKVKALEESNSELEDKIKNWYEAHKPKNVDNSKYFETIEDLRDQIIDATNDNNQLSVEVDNARLAADDFRVKYETELKMRQSVEADVECLRKELDDLTLEKASLEGQVEGLTEEIAHNKINHEEEMKALQGQSSDVNVQVDAAPGINILKVLNDIRSQYEEMAEENRRKAEEEYNQMIAELNHEISYSSAEVESAKSELAELRRTVQTMEIDLQSQLAMKCSLENALTETRVRYAQQLSHLQEIISNLEELLAQVRCEMENESCRYNQLLDIKNRLQNEIEMYRRLVDEEGGSNSDSGSVSGNGSRRGSASGSTSGPASGPNRGSSSGYNRGFSSGSTSSIGSSSSRVTTSGSVGNSSHGTNRGYSNEISSGSTSETKRGFSSGSTSEANRGFSNGSTSSATNRGYSSGSTTSENNRGFSSGSTTSENNRGFSSGSSHGLNRGTSSSSTSSYNGGFSSGSSSGATKGSTKGSSGSGYGSHSAEGMHESSSSMADAVRKRVVATITEERMDRRVVSSMGPVKG